MTITREQVADLRVGDVVELSWPDGTTLRGALRASQREPGHLLCGPMTLRHDSGRPTILHQDAALTVISRAPRPLYVNHERENPTIGDVVRDADSDNPMTWAYLDLGGRPWRSLEGPFFDWFPKVEMPQRLRLLVDGETGQVVP